CPRRRGPRGRSAGSLGRSVRSHSGTSPLGLHLAGSSLELAHLDAPFARTRAHRRSACTSLARPSSSLTWTLRSLALAHIAARLAPRWLVPRARSLGLGDRVLVGLPRHPRLV